MGYTKWPDSDYAATPSSDYTAWPGGDYTANPGDNYTEWPAGIVQAGLHLVLPVISPSFEGTIIPANPVASIIGVNYFDGWDADTVNTSGSNVTSWPGRVSRTLTATGTPQYSATGFGPQSRPYVQFSGTNDVRSDDAALCALASGTGNALSFVAAFSLQTITTFDTLFGWGCAAVANSAKHVLWLDGANRIEFSRTRDGGSSVNKNTGDVLTAGEHYLIGSWGGDGGNCEVWLDGALILAASAISDTVAATLTRFSIGRFYNNGTGSFGGDYRVSELHVASGGLTTDQVDDLHTYLAGKYT